MKMDDFMAGIMRANFHDGGIKCLRLFRITPGFFNSLRSEVMALSERFTPSDVSDPAHVSHPVTKPYGRNYQYSLFNRSGRCDDFSDDWNKSSVGKKFHHEPEFPALAAFIDSLENRTNMKLLVLGAHSGLFPHEAHLISPADPYRILLRFHLPILTNEHCEMLLDDEYFRFHEQYIYFFNEGCIHSAYNHGSTPRMHLSWDMHLDRSLYTKMFGEEVFRDGMLERLPAVERMMLSHRSEKTKEYELQGSSKLVYEAWHLGKIGISPMLFNRYFNKLSYWKYNILKKRYTIAIA